MAVRIHPSVARRIEDNPGGITLQVAAASDVELAESALRAARAEIARLDGGWESAPGLSPGDTNGPTHLSAVTNTPSGPMLYVDGGFTPIPLLQTIPLIIARHVREAGVRDAQVVWPDRQGPDAYDLYDFQTGNRRMAVLRLFAPPPPLVPLGQRQPLARAPASWFDEAAAWLSQEVGPDSLLWTITGVATFSIPARDAAAQLGKRIGSQLLLAGDLRSRLRAAETQSLAHEVLTLGAGGPAASDGELVAAAEALVAIARRRAPETSYALIDFDPAFAYGSMERLPRPRERERRVGLTEMSRFSGELVLDAGPYQILGPGHLARLGAALEEAGPGVRVDPLGSDRVELRVGELSSWVPDHPMRSDLRAAARRLFTPCILAQIESSAFMAEKRRGNPNPTTETPAPEAGGPLPNKDVDA